MHPFHYIVVIDRSQTGQTLFLKSLARGAAKHKDIRGIFLHTDNDRTDELLQDGIMRGDARKRVVKETNRRLVDLFAEAGVGSVGLQWHQVGSIDADGSVAFLNDPRTRIPHSTHLILSNLNDEDGDVIDLNTLAEVLATALELPVIQVTSSRVEGVFVVKDAATGPETNTVGDDDKARTQKIGIDTWNTLNDYIRGI